jgi:predicted ATPase
VPRPATVLLLADALDLNDHDRAELIASAHGSRPEGAKVVAMPTAMSSVPTRNNLTPSLSPFVGRVAELDRLRLALAGARLVTLTGTGGVGKTRLALEAAAQLAEPATDAYPDGVWRVELAPVAEGVALARSIAAVLGIRDVPGQEALDVLVHWARNRRLLLVLDNCEHLVNAVSHVVNRLLAECQDLSILATSREPLRVSGEVVFPVHPLSADSDALVLFTNLAARVSPSFVLTAEIRESAIGVCRRLDGLPLAIELAAARVNVLTVEEIEQRLDQRFALLGPTRRGATPRHHTLRAMVDWSYDLLAPAEQQLLQELSVFAGGWTLDAAEAVCMDDPTQVLPLLCNLVDKSLVQADQRDGASRYRLLETLRDYAAEKLRQTGTEQSVRTRHLQWCEDLARTGDPGLSGPEHRQWLPRLEAEVGNFRAGLRWSLLHPSELDRGLRTAGLLVRLWFLGGASAEGMEWLTELLANAPATPARVEALSAAGFLLVRRGEPERARPFLDEAVRLARHFGKPHLLVVSLHHFGELCVQEGDITAAKTALQESVDLHTGGADWPVFWPPYVALYNLGEAAEIEGDRVQAAAYYRRSIDMATDHRDGFRTVPLRLLAQLALDRHDYATARDLLRESLIVAHDWVKGWTAAPVLVNFAELALAEGEPERALRLGGAAIGQRAGLGERLEPTQASRLEPVLSEARQLLSADLAAQAWAEGCKMSLDQAVRYALAARD